MSLVTRKPVFGVCDELRLNLGCSTTEISYSFQISAIASTDIVLSRQWTTKELITARMCRLICYFVVCKWHKQIFSWCVLFHVLWDQPELSLSIHLLHRKKFGDILKAVLMSNFGFSYTVFFSTFSSKWVQVSSFSKIFFSNLTEPSYAAKKDDTIQSLYMLLIITRFWL